MINDVHLAVHDVLLRNISEGLRPYPFFKKTGAIQQHTHLNSSNVIS